MNPWTPLASAVLCALAAAAHADAATGAVTGRIVYADEAPAMRPINMGADPSCAAMHPDGDPPLNEALVLGDDNAMANVFVHVAKGLPEDAEHAAPEEPVVLDQAGCRYAPRVFGILVGQTLQVLNSDGILHNVNGRPRVNPPFNRAMTRAIEDIEIVFEDPEDFFEFRCDVHPWMRAYCRVMTHPYFHVTLTDGQFRIEGLPPGEYEIEAWHERLGTQSAAVTIAAGETATHDFSFQRPGR